MDGPCRSSGYAGIDCVPIPTERVSLWLGCGVDEITAPCIDSGRGEIEVEDDSQRLTRTSQKKMMKICASG